MSSVLASIPPSMVTRKLGPHRSELSSFLNDQISTSGLNSDRFDSMPVYLSVSRTSCLWQASQRDLKCLLGAYVLLFLSSNTLLNFMAELLSEELKKKCFRKLSKIEQITNMTETLSGFITIIIQGKYIIILQQIYCMSYLNADQLEKSILGKSVLVSDPVRIQAAANLENVPGIKMKGATEQWANADICVICKQPFNPQRKINRHHCRICGGSVCGECSRKKINNQRCCDFCFLKQYLKKQQHERKEQFRLREQNIQKMNEEMKQFEVEIDNLEKEIVQVEKTNIELEVKLNKEITEKQIEVQKKQEDLKKRQQLMEKRKAELTSKKQELDSREDRNKIYFSKVQIIKLDISSKQTSLLEKMEELERLKSQLDKLESQRRDLMAEFK